MDGVVRSMARADAVASNPRVAVVIAVFNEGGTVDLVADGVLSAFADLPMELIFVDDGSDDATAARLDALARGSPSVVALHHDRRCGKTAALLTGISAARAPLIVTMDGDGQNDPGDARALLEALVRAPGAIVAGVRARRHDAWSRRVATRVANRFRRAVLRDGCPDTGCGLKAFDRAAFLRLPAFEGMHRFLPALFGAFGAALVCHPVSHRARVAGQSKYTNWGRALVGVVDLLGVVWLRSRTHRPGAVVQTRSPGTAWPDA